MDAGIVARKGSERAVSLATTLDGPVDVTIERAGLPIWTAGPPSDLSETLGKLS